MKKADAIARLKPLEHRLRERGISALYLFGSTARDEAGDTSDLDLLFETDPACRFSLFDQAGIMIELSDQLETKVDFVPRKALKPYVRRHVETDLVQVF
ncbi:MAG: nucleotidyltransferase domain-containing protein [Sphingobium sp.]